MILLMYYDIDIDTRQKKSVMILMYTCIKLLTLHTVLILLVD